MINHGFFLVPMLQRGNPHPLETEVAFPRRAWEREEKFFSFFFYFIILSTNKSQEVPESRLTVVNNHSIGKAISCKEVFIKHGFVNGMTSSHQHPVEICTACWKLLNNYILS